MSILLDGKSVARDIRAEVKERVEVLVRQGLPRPHLAAVLVGDDPASATYVSMKGRACGWVGIASSVHTLGASASQSEVVELVDRLNADPTVNGILIQHPLPRGIHEQTILDRVDPRKDVDGLSSASLGALLTGGDGFVACTPLGILELLDRYHIPIEGKEAVVIGRSIILGKPMALLLLARHATVTICHSRTTNLAEVTRRADILVAAVGRPELITGSMIKPGAVVVDAGYNKVEGRAGDVGDVEFETASGRASYITPVPGGVGPMTIAMLLRNTVRAAEMAHGIAR